MLNLINYTELTIGVVKGLQQCVIENSEQLGCNKKNLKREYSWQRKNQSPKRKLEIWKIAQ